MDAKIEYDENSISSSKLIPKQDLDPFSPTNCPKLSLIVLMRIYDVQMAMLTVQDKVMAAKLAEEHARGNIVGALPFIDLTEND